MSTSRKDLRRANAAGIDLLVRDGAPERTIVLLHGIGGRAASFAPLMRQWPTGPRLIAWDAPGYGQSAPLQNEWPVPEDYAWRLMAVFDELRLDRIDLIGQSLGALIAGELSHGPKINRLVLMSPALGYGVPRGGPLPDALAKRCADFIAEAAVAFAAKRAPRLVYDADRQPAIVDAVRSAMATLSNPGHAQAVRMLASGDLLFAAAKIRAPTLIINGAEDVITPPNGAKALFEVLQNRPREPHIYEKIQIIPSAGHAVYLEQSSAVLAAIQVFLEDRP